ncbi:MAG: hypothetical protein GX075_01750 [Firmicutes bacterium]|nr:hypothetical protein [Bacillota bacterium]
MKKLSIIIISVLLIISFATATMGGSVYIDHSIWGQWEYKDNEGKGDGELILSTVGLEADINNFIIGLEGHLKTLVFEDDWFDEKYEVDYTGYQLKAGWRVVNGEKFDAALIVLGYYRERDQNSDQNSKYNLNGILLGTDLTFYLSDLISLEGSLGISVDAALKSEESGETFKNDAELIFLRLKYNYLYTENFGIYLSIKSFFEKYDDEFNSSFLSSGLAVGFNYRF